MLDFIFSMPIHLGSDLFKNMVYKVNKTTFGAFDKPLSKTTACYHGPVYTNRIMQENFWGFILSFPERQQKLDLD